MDLFLPRNLELQEDGSLIAKDMTKDIPFLDNESFSDYYKKYVKETAKLKNYEIIREIPLEQKKEYYWVQIFSEPTHLTQKEQDECKTKTLVFEKLFLYQYNAEKWAENKIKQQSIACYHSKYNPNKRQYKFSYILTNNKEKVYIEEEAVNGKVIKREAFYGD